MNPMKFSMPMSVVVSTLAGFGLRVFFLLRVRILESTAFSVRFNAVISWSIVALCFTMLLSSRSSLPVQDLLLRSVDGTGAGDGAG